MLVALMWDFHLILKNKHVLDGISVYDILLRCIENILFLKQIVSSDK